MFDYQSVLQQIKKLEMEYKHTLKTLEIQLRYCQTAAQIEITAKAMQKAEEVYQNKNQTIISTWYKNMEQSETASDQAQIAQLKKTLPITTW